MILRRRCSIVVRGCRRWIERLLLVIIRLGARLGMPWRIISDCRTVSGRERESDHDLEPRQQFEYRFSDPG